MIAHGELPPTLERPEDGFRFREELVQIPDPLRPTETRLIGHGGADDGSLARHHGERGLALLRPAQQPVEVALAGEEPVVVAALGLVRHQPPAAGGERR